MLNSFEAKIDGLGYGLEVYVDHREPYQNYDENWNDEAEDYEDYREHDDNLKKNHQTTHYFTTEQNYSIVAVITDLEGNRINDGIPLVAITREADGETIYNSHYREGEPFILNNCEPGNWRIDIEASPDTQFIVNLSAFGQPRTPGFWKCLSCKLVLKALVKAIILLATGSYLPDDLLDALQLLIGEINNRLVNTIIGIVEFFVNPVDQLLEWLCKKLGFCR
ncbi:MAG: hypothetical protein KDD67_14305 [Ignavibacteriae bacterium]|nr:hypothetical protein [Ignavibacteriota bacterium]